MRKSFTLNCLEWNPRHVRFQLIDQSHAVCGVITILTSDVKDFIRFDWSGDVQWNGKLPPGPDNLGL